MANGPEKADARERTALVELSAALGTRERGAWRSALEAAAGRADPAAVEEVLLQAYLFVGFPVVLAAMTDWRTLEGAAEAAPSSPDAEGPETWTRRGEALCRRVYGSAYPGLRRNVRRLHPALDRWMVTEGYGKVLSRPGLAPATRELCVVALLAVTGGDPQLHSHLRGGLRLGATPGEVEAALVAGLAHVPDAEVREARRALWQRVRRREKDRKRP